MKFPTVHLNGTSENELLEQLTRAMQAIRDAEVALDNAAPNGRDYYVQHAGAFEIAIEEHVARCKKLAAVRDELQEIAVHIAFERRER